MGCLQEACEGYTSELFCHVADHQTEVHGAPRCRCLPGCSRSQTRLRQALRRKGLKVQNVLNLRLANQIKLNKISGQFTLRALICDSGFIQFTQQSIDDQGLALVIKINTYETKQNKLHTGLPSLKNISNMLSHVIPVKDCVHLGSQM